MYVSTAQHQALEAVDLRKSRDHIDIWVRGASVSFMTDPDEARWLIGALQAALDAIPGVPADEPEGEIFTIRSPAHPLFKHLSPASRPNIQPGEAPSKEGKASG